jgi:transposase
MCQNAAFNLEAEMRVKLIDGDRWVLQSRVAHERRALARDRFRVVLLAGEGFNAKEQTREQIAGAVGRSRQFVDQWAGRYRRLGLAGLEAGKAKGNTPSLTPAELETFKKRMLAGPTDADQGKCTLRGRDAQRILEAEFNKPLKLSTVYSLMHKAGLSCLRPRPRHRKNDPVAMKQWLDRAPFLSRT